MRIALTALFLTLTCAGCATVETNSVLSRSLNTPSFASVGDVVLRVELKEDLPNAFGGADIYGRTRDRGFSELRYMGLADEDTIIFRRREVDIITNENVFSRQGFGSAIISSQPSGAGTMTTGVYTRPQSANVQALPPDTIEIEFNLSEGNVMTLRGHTIEITDASQNGISFIVRD